MGKSEQVRVDPPLRGTAVVDGEVKCIAGLVVAALRNSEALASYEVKDIGPLLVSSGEIIHAIEINSPLGEEFVIDIYRFVRA